MDFRNKKIINGQPVDVPERIKDKDGWLHCVKNDLINKIKI